MDTKVVGGLEWKSEVSAPLSWAELKGYAETLQHGWRLPTVQELLTLVDFGRTAPACSLFPETPGDYFWTSTAEVYDDDSVEYSSARSSAPEQAGGWVVDFGVGWVSRWNSFKPDAPGRVRCVRDVNVAVKGSERPRPAVGAYHRPAFRLPDPTWASIHRRGLATEEEWARRDAWGLNHPLAWADLWLDFDSAELETVLVGDLEWQAVPEGPFSVDEAQVWVDAAFAGGWRIPTIEELLSLNRYDRPLSACAVFREMPSAKRTSPPDAHFWSSSEDFFHPDSRWCLSSDGESKRSGDEGRERCLVRAVRSLR